MKAKGEALDRKRRENRIRRHPVRQAGYQRDKCRPVHAQRLVAFGAGVGIVAVSRSWRDDVRWQCAATIRAATLYAWGVDRKVRRGFVLVDRGGEYPAIC